MSKLYKLKNTVEVLQYIAGTATKEVIDFVGEDNYTFSCDVNCNIHIKNTATDACGLVYNGNTYYSKLRENDYIMKSPNNNIRVFRAEDFELFYEAIE